ncbi:GNAT family protein [Alkalihalophilus lindianensis]|uniref:GNAT family protein n=1 Tax=Alkalihalophilus lindianensis TaxID=1630542 RepID=A0ABU3XCH0_9BACI|nr:GNAT family protein [Alkalihalophilus lindianensis]MDV2685580.1 GNAT family protein [Alkalihalophilus lindianensis]
MFVVEISDKCYLKLLEPRDAESLYSLINSSRDHLRRWLPWLDSNTTLKDSESFIHYSLEQFSNNNGFQAGIWYEENLVGLVGINSIMWNHKTASLGYWLGENYEGKGLVTSACSKIIDYIFTDLALNRIEIRVAEGNAKSKAIPERLGFELEGLSRESEWLYDHYEDTLIYGLLSKDYKKTKCYNSLT